MAKPNTMTFAISPAELKAARLKLNLYQDEMGQMLGYKKGKGARQQIHYMEHGERSIREAQALLVQAYLDGYRPKNWPKEAIDRAQIKG